MSKDVEPSPSMFGEPTPGIPGFHEVCDTGKVVHRGGWHKPGQYPRRLPDCGCTKTTDKGAYRDVVVEYESATVYYYHQSAVVIEYPDCYRVSSCGWQTSTTKERISRHLPTGYRVRQIDFDWYLETPDERREFHDAMFIYPEDP
jgi:hypothetical protein